MAPTASSLRFKSLSCFLMARSVCSTVHYSCASFHRRDFSTAATRRELHHAPVMHAYTYAPFVRIEFLCCALAAQHAVFDKGHSSPLLTHVYDDCPRHSRFLAVPNYEVGVGFSCAIDSAGIFPLVRIDFKAVAVLSCLALSGGLRPVLPGGFFVLSCPASVVMSCQLSAPFRTVAPFY